jgi:hypothetical protein
MATVATVPAISTRRSHGAAARAVPMTFLLGATVVASWVGVQGTGIINGPGPWLHETWFAVWAIQALLAFGLLVAVEWTAPSATDRAMVGMVLLAWLGELVAAAVIATMVVGELDVVHAPYVWLVGTGFGLQPSAAILGGLAARRRRSHSASAVQ